MTRIASSGTEHEFRVKRPASMTPRRCGRGRDDLIHNRDARRNQSVEAVSIAQALRWL